jgi:tRNA pseudouridine55 synthase
LIWLRKSGDSPGPKKWGHAGTLDPLATGLLILCTGKMTRQIDTFQAQEKEYTGSLTLGVTTPCYDRELEEDGVFETAHITEKAIYEMAQKFTGLLIKCRRLILR